MTETQIQQLLESHNAWLESNQHVGRQLIAEGEQWKGVCFSGRDVSNARLSGCKFIDCRLENSDFSNSAFLSARFLNCQFLRCRFVNADLRGLIADHGDFSSSNFTRCDLTDAVLTRSNLTRCALDWSWLVRTDLRFADLTGVRLENARLLRTKLCNDRHFRFALPAKITVQDLDFSREGDGSLLTGIEGLRQLAIA
jgi:uncharacterized protein YjbI with pentapeptide repeats